MRCTACLRALRCSQPQALHAQALSGWKKRIMQDHWSRDERMGGRHAASQAHSTNVMCHRARRHAYRFLRLGGGPADPARMPPPRGLSRGFHMLGH